MGCGLGFRDLVHNYGHFITSVLHNFGRALYMNNPGIENGVIPCILPYEGKLDHLHQTTGMTKIPRGYFRKFFDEGYIRQPNKSCRIFTPDLTCMLYCTLYWNTHFWYSVQVKSSVKMRQDLFGCLIPVARYTS